MMKSGRTQLSVGLVSRVCRYWIRSSVACAWQVPPLQLALWQSPATWQNWPVTQVAPQTPPQSVSVSVWFLTPSAQVGLWQMPAVQTPLWQSVDDVQPRPAAQRLQLGPPQSTALSLPFLTESVQLGGWQVPPVQTPL